MAFEGMRKRLKDDITGPNSTMSYITIATVMNSYYAKDADKNDNPQVYLDVVIMDSGGSSKRSHTRVPMVKIGGLSTSLPLIGSLAVLAYINNDSDAPIALGTMDSKVTSTINTDTKAPRRLPSVMTK
jgi:hypothetical protein